MNIYMLNFVLIHLSVFSGPSPPVVTANGESNGPEAPTKPASADDSGKKDKDPSVSPTKGESSRGEATTVEEPMVRKHHTPLTEDDSDTTSAEHKEQWEVISEKEVQQVRPFYSMLYTQF